LKLLKTNGKNHKNRNTLRDKIGQKRSFAIRQYLKKGANVAS